jgi:hypothetical protein
MCFGSVVRQSMGDGDFYGDEIWGVYPCGCLRRRRSYMSRSHV